jgi:hypothetical protein
MADITTTENLNKVNAICVDAYVSEFNLFAAKTADAIIGMGRVVFRAKQNLGSDFAKFCEDIRFKEKSSAIRKLEQIGRKADFLEKYADRLPNTWTTVYRLTQLGNDVLETAIEKGAVHATMTGIDAGKLLVQFNGVPASSKRNIKQIVSSAPVAANDGAYEITLRFDGVPDRAKVQSLEMVVNGLAATTGNCNVIRSQPLDVLMQDQPKAAA